MDKLTLAFVDTETTDLDPNRGRVLEVGCKIVEVHGAQLTVQDTFLFRQRINRSSDHWNPGAFKINGYTDDHPDWADAPMVGSEVACAAWTKLAEMTSCLELCSQNIDRFDKPFIANEMDRFGIVPKWERRTVEIMSFAMLIALEKDVRNAKGRLHWSLHDAYKAINGPEIQEHRAMADIARGMAVYEYVARRFFVGVQLVGRNNRDITEAV